MDMFEQIRKKSEAKMHDAGHRLTNASHFLKEQKYGEVFRECQKAVELSLKALLDELVIEYKERKRFLHEVSELIPEAMDKLKNVSNIYGEYTRDYLSMGVILSKMLSSIKDEMEGYGVINKIGIGVDDFSARSNYKDLAEVIIKMAGQLHTAIHGSILTWYRESIKNKENKK